MSTRNAANSLDWDGPGNRMPSGFPDKLAINGDRLALCHDAPSTGGAGVVQEPAEAHTMPAPALEDLRVASHISVFGGLKPEVIARLIAPATVLTLKHGDCLFHQGDSAVAFFIVVDGWMKLYRLTMGGDEAIIHILTKGESLPEAVALTGARYAATAEAVSNVRIVRIPADYLVRCIREMPDLALAMIASSSRRLNRLVQEIEHLKAQSGIQRVAEFLASLCPAGPGPHMITLPYDKTLIAGRLGLKPESLSRAFAKLRRVGVDVHSSHVVINEVSKLRYLAANERVGVGTALTSKLGSALTSKLNPARTSKH
jgi:CRP-like cAMP-binding protein